MIRAVIDTNVLVSGLLSPKGNEALTLLAVGQGLVRPCLTEDILVEYASVLAQPKFNFTPQRVARSGRYQTVLILFPDAPYGRNPPTQRATPEAG